MYQRAGTSSGGGGGNVASGTSVKVNGVEVTTLTGECEAVIDTGLTEINYFNFSSGNLTANQYFPSVVYDKTINSDKFWTMTTSGENAGYGNYNIPIGTAPTAPAIYIKSINNGVVTLRTPSNYFIYPQSHLHWFAE